MIAEASGDLVLNSLNDLIESTQDFTDSLYVSNDQRERITRLQNEIRDQTLSYLKEETTHHDINNNSPDLNKSVTSRILNNCDVLKKLLQAQTMQIVNNLFKENQDAVLLNCLKKYSLLNHYDLLIDTLDKFKEYSDHVLEVNLEVI